MQVWLSLDFCGMLKNSHATGNNCNLILCANLRISVSPRSTDLLNIKKLLVHGSIEIRNLSDVNI